MKFLKSLILSACTVMLVIPVSIGADNAAIYLLLLDGQNSLTGTWSLYLTETGGEEQGPYEFGIKQEGSSLNICESDRVYNGSMESGIVTIDFGFDQFVSTSVTISGIYGIYSGGTWWMVKTSDETICVDIDPWDIDANGIPEFVSSEHIELDKIHRISKFRSGEGHDYSDDFESCRSMKHYYNPIEELDWSQIKIYSPVNGTILQIEQEGHPNSGMQVHIRSTEYPAFTFRIFHVSVHESISEGSSVSAGQEIGTHISNITTDDIAVGVTTPIGWKLISFFSVMTDSLFLNFQARGVPSRDDLIISKEARDSDPLNCTGETFGTTGTIDNWITLLVE